MSGKLRSGAVVLLGLLAGGCAHSDHLSLSHRHAPDGEARIVVMPVEFEEGIKVTQDEGATLASLYATELLRSYEILDFRRFEKVMTARGLDLETILENGAGAELADELGIDGVLLSRVYSWKPGVPGFWFLAKQGRVGFAARLIDLRTGSLIWSANRVRETRPADPLPVGLTYVFQDLATEMPAYLAPY